MIPNNNSRRIVPFLWISVFLFIGFLLLLSNNVRLCGDDMHILNAYIEKGWFQSVYSHTSIIRWSSILLFNSIFLINEDIQTTEWSILSYYLFVFTYLFTSLSFLFRVIIFKITNTAISYKDSFLISVIFSIVLYFSTSENIDVWFWPLSSTVYLFPVISFILGFAYLLSDKKGFWTYLVICFTFLFIGGAVENFALAVLFILSGILFLSFF